MKIKGTFTLEAGDKITAALGQQGSNKWGCCGSGGSFLILETTEGQKPLLIAGGAGSAKFNENFERGKKVQNPIENEQMGSRRSVRYPDPGSSGLQQYIKGDENLEEAIYCAGAGFKKAPIIKGNLVRNCLAPKTYRKG